MTVRHARSGSRDRIAELLTAAQLGDSALPIGRFAHSNGAEQWLGSHPAATDAEFDEFVRCTVIEGVAPLDGVATAAAHACETENELIRLDRELDARKLAPAARAASRSCGRQLLALSLTLADDPLTTAFDRQVRCGTCPGNLAVVEGRLSRSLGLGVDLAVALSLRGSLAAMFSAAVRLSRMAPSRAQAMMMAAVPGMALAAGQAAASEWEEAHSSAPVSDLSMLAHQPGEGRIFAS